MKLYYFSCRQQGKEFKFYAAGSDQLAAFRSAFRYLSYADVESVEMMVCQGPMEKGACHYEVVRHGFPQDEILYDGEWSGVYLCLMANPDACIRVLEGEALDAYGSHYANLMAAMA